MQELDYIIPQYVNFANINIKALVNAVGKQSNYTIENADGTISYINELNAFGIGEKLHANSLLLYIYLHFLGPNNNAHVLLDIVEASNFLNMSVRTLRNNLRILRRKGYINYINGILDDTYDIFIEYYQENNLNAISGGRGYISMTKNTFISLIAIHGTNKLRFAIRALLNDVPGKQNMGFSSGCSMKDLKRIFPSYTKKKEILNILSDTNIKRLFDIKVSRSMSYCQVIVKDNFSSHALKDELLKTAHQKIKQTFQSLEIKHQHNQFNPTAKELNDICKISLRTPLKQIETAIHKLYYNYSRATVKNLPGLIRVLATE